jgi:hypothetical protein
VIEDGSDEARPLVPPEFIDVPFSAVGLIDGQPAFAAWIREFESKPILRTFVLRPDENGWDEVEVPSTGRLVRACGTEDGPH